MFQQLPNFKHYFSSLGQKRRQTFKEIDQAFDEINDLYQQHKDPFGLNLEETKKKFKLLYPLYKNYFRVRVIGKEKMAAIPSERPLMIVSNHSGQIPIDGMLLTVAFMLDVIPARLVRSMVERFVNTIPFVGTWMAESGAVLGDRANCLYLLNRGESILVFPEGVRGISKSSTEYYQVQSMTQGFLRMALTAKVDILPVAVVGAEEFYPWIHQAKSLAKFLKMPALPLSPTFLLGPLGMIPMPSPVDIHIGDIYTLPKELEADAPEEVIAKHVQEIEETIQKMLQDGQESRRPFFAISPNGKTK